jgi:hypothetical protein
VPSAIAAKPGGQATERIPHHDNLPCPNPLEVFAHCQHNFANFVVVRPYELRFGPAGVDRGVVCNFERVPAIDDLDVVGRMMTPRHHDQQKIQTSRCFLL